MDYRPVGAGIQIEGDLGCYTCGFEFILYWDSSVCNGGGWVLAVYSYDGSSINMSDPLLGSIVATIADNKDLLICGTEESINSLIEILKGKVSGSISGVLIFGDESFISMESYEGPFTCISGNISHAKGAFAYSSNSFAISLGATTNKSPSWGFSRTNYKLRTSFQFDSANTTLKRTNRAVSVLERSPLI